MPQAFDAQNPPFDRLTHGEIAELRAKLDIGYLRAGRDDHRRRQAAENLHVIIKGAVEERDGEEIEAVLGPKDSFDSRALVHGAAGAAFVAADETLCYLAPRSVVLDLIARNSGFAAFFYHEVSVKLDSYSTRAGRHGRRRAGAARPRQATRDYIRRRSSKVRRR